MERSALHRLTRLEAILDSALVEFAGKDTRRPYSDYDGKVAPGSVASPKLDGVYARADPTGLYTRTGRRIENQPGIERAMLKRLKRIPAGSVEGELYAKGGLEETVGKLKGGKPLKFHPFPEQGKIRGGRFVKPIRGKKVDTPEAADRLYRKALRKGYEGQVIQDPTGARVRRKPQDDGEFEVAKVGAGRKGGVVAHVRDGERVAKVLIPKGGVKQGQRLTVTHQGRTAKGNLRHPRYKAVRDYE